MDHRAFVKWFGTFNPAPVRQLSEAEYQRMVAYGESMQRYMDDSQIQQTPQQKQRAIIRQLFHQHLIKQSPKPSQPPVTWADVIDTLDIDEKTKLRYKRNLGP